MRVIYVDVLAGVNLAMDYLLLAAAAKLSGAYCTRPACSRVRRSVRAMQWQAAGFHSSPCCPSRQPPGFLWCVFALARAAQPNLSGWRRCSIWCPVRLRAARLRSAKSAIQRSLPAAGTIFDVPFRVVAAAGAVSWGLTGLLFRGEAKAREACRVHLDFAGRSADFSLLVDTGNDLSDPVSGRPALVLDRRAAARVLPVEAALPLAALRADNAPAVLAALPGTYRTQFQLLPYRAIGKEGGLLLAFRPERAERDGKPWQGLAAISPERVANGFYEGLIGL